MFHKMKKKTIHQQVFHILAVPAIVMGFLTVLDSHNLNVPPITNFYTLHSWMGLATMGLFAIQVARMVIESPITVSSFCRHGFIPSIEQLIDHFFPIQIASVYWAKC